jgi:predicted nucleotidyltransferase
MTSLHHLTPAQLKIIHDTLKPYADHIDRVGLFGSRATGRCHDYSDIDMVLYGQIDAQLLDRLVTLFDESALSIKVDLVAYDLIDNPVLKQHIDTVMLPLFTKADF